jgi:hypothetical protein
MGYVNDDITLLGASPLGDAVGTVAAWAVGVSEVAGVYCYACDATAEVAHLFVHLRLPSHVVNSIGALDAGFQLKTIEIDYNVKTAACAAVTVVINKVTRGANGAVAVVSTPAFAYDANHDTAAKRYALAPHKMILTLSAPAWVRDDQFYVLDITIDKAATSIVQFLGAWVKGTLRL